MCRECHLANGAIYLFRIAYVACKLIINICTMVSIAYNSFWAKYLSAGSAIHHFKVDYTLVIQLLHPIIPENSVVF